MILFVFRTLIKDPYERPTSKELLEEEFIKNYVKVIKPF